MTGIGLDGFGLLLLAGVGVASLATGLPVFAVLIGAAMIGAAAAVASGTVPLHLFAVLPARILALLEHDLLQALPLYVAMGVLIEKMHIAPGLLSALTAISARPNRLPLPAVILLGALTGPMNGSVSANVMAVARSAAPRLPTAGGTDAAKFVTVAVAGTLGLVVPPSLVLILLGDAMMAAHTIAANTTGRMDRIVNTQDVFRAALMPAAIFITAALAIAAWLSRSGRQDASTGKALPDGTSHVTAILTIAVLVALLSAVAAGYLYAVEAAATGALLLLALGLITGRLQRAKLGDILDETLVTTGVLFAPLVAATTFTLVLRTLQTDKLVAGWLAALPGSDWLAVLCVLAVIAVSALVLDAFEIIFVVVPIAVPPLLIRVPDAVWVAALVLLTLQLSFLLPPAGYALLMTRKALKIDVAGGALLRTLSPFIGALLATIALVLYDPRLVHLTGATAPATAAASRPAGSAPASDFAVPAPALDSPSLAAPPSFK